MDGTNVEEKLPDVTPEFEEEEFKVEVIDENEEVKDEATLALEAKIAEMEAEQARYKEEIEKLSTKTTQEDSLASLAAQLKAMASPPMEKPKNDEPQVDFKTLFEEVDKNFYNSPSKAVVDVVTPIVQSMDKKYNDIIASQALNISKLAVLSDETLKGDYLKYKDEVEQIVSASPPSEKVYREALLKVRASHFDEILNEKLEAKMNEVLKKAEEQQAPQAPQSFTNATMVQQARPTNTVRITAGQQAVAKKWAMNKGYDWNDPSDKAWVLKYLKNNGVI